MSLQALISGLYLCYSLPFMQLAPIKQELLGQPQHSLSSLVSRTQLALPGGSWLRVRYLQSIAGSVVCLFESLREQHCGALAVEFCDEICSCLHIVRAYEVAY